MSKTISQVSRQLSVSTRTLRYYEEMGLITSRREPGYAYRVYDEDTLARLQCIVFLRKLRIPLKSIGILLSCDDAQRATKVLREHMAELNDEIAQRRQIIQLLTMLESAIRKGDMSWRETLLQLPPTLPESTKEEIPMNKTKPHSKLADVRILTLPRMAVASAHSIGPEPENHAANSMWSFIRKHNISAVKPDARVFGFNHPDPSPERAHYGYEYWITIPEEMEVPAPLTKKTMDGGLYAVHTIKMGDFHEWQELFLWVEDSDEYEVAFRPTGMGGALEEHLNALHWPEDESKQQLDLYLPIRKKEVSTPCNP